VSFCGAGVEEDEDEDEVEDWIDSWLEVRREKMLEGGRTWSLAFGLPALFYELMHSCILVLFSEAHTGPREHENQLSKGE